MLSVKRIVGFLTTVFLLGFSSASGAENKPVIADGQIIASIKPVHSLVQSVVGDLATVTLLVDAAVSPHSFKLKPSQHRELQNASFVFYVDENLESFLKRSFSLSAENRTLVALANGADIELLEKRRGGTWQRRVSDDKRERDSHAHDHDSHHDSHKGEHREDAHHGHHHGDTNEDLHIWLDPINAKKMLERIASVLATRYPEHSTQFETNSARTAAAIEELHQELATELKAYKNVPFVVFHDAYGYFEKRYSLNGIGAIVLDPGFAPSAAQIKQVRATIQSSGALCVFSEPQFPKKLVNTVIEGSAANSAVLDPLGAALKIGPNLYLELIQAISDSFLACFSKSQSTSS